MSYEIKNYMKILNINKFSTGTTSDEFVLADMTMDVPENCMECDDATSGYTYIVPEATGSGRQLIIKNTNITVSHALWVYFGNSTLDGNLRNVYPSCSSTDPPATFNMDNNILTIVDTGPGTWSTISYVSN